MDATVDYSKEGKEFPQTTNYGATYTKSEVTMIERGAVLKFAKALNEKIRQIVQLPNDQYRSHTEIIYKSDFLSVLRNHGIEEKEL